MLPAACSRLCNRDLAIYHHHHVVLQAQISLFLAIRLHHPLLSAAGLLDDILCLYRAVEDRCGGRWPYSYCFVGYCFQDLFNIAWSILVQFPSSSFSIRLVCIHEVPPHSRIDTISIWKKLHFILSVWFDFHMIDNQSIATHTIAGRIMTSFSMEETLLLRYVNLFTDFREPPFTFWLKHMYSVFSSFI